MSIEPVVKRSIIVVGKTGAGKSSLLNRLIGKGHFRAACQTKSCTERIESHTSGVTARVYVNRDRQNERDIAYDLTVFDTPGIADSEGRSKQFLNEIAETIKTTPLNLIIILVEYSIQDVGFYNNLEVLRECLNGLSQLSTMIIINKVPTKEYLEKKQKQGEVVPDRKKTMEEFFERISQCLGTRFKYQVFLENEDHGETKNEDRFDFMRKVILSRKSYIESSRVKTWDQLIDNFSRDIQITRYSMEDLAEDLKDELDKIEFDIADVKYPFLEHGRDFDLDLTYVQNLECKITKEEYDMTHIAYYVLDFYHIIFSILKSFC
jgi:GTPase SAR1 family protein